MTPRKRILSLILGLFFLLSSIPALTEGQALGDSSGQPTEASETIPGDAGEEASEGTTEETTEETTETSTMEDSEAVPSPDPEPTPRPFAALPTTAKKDMPKPNPDAKAEVFLTQRQGSDLFELPSTESALLHHLPAGSVLELMILGRTWSRVKAGNQEGWLPTTALSFGLGDSQPNLAIVTARGGKLSLRSQMSTRSKALDSIKSGRAVLLLAKGEVFSLVRHGKLEGYVLSAHLEEMPLGQVLGLYTGVVSIVSDREANVRLRAQPKRNATAYTTVKSGNSVVVIDIKDDWAQIEFEGYHGYMMAEYLKRFD